MYIYRIKMKFFSLTFLMLIKVKNVCKQNESGRSFRFVSGRVELPETSARDIQKKTSLALLARY